ncbi:hypothetical protein [Pseudomonas sp. NBRC 111135]|uniref:hypothetical protein n=1 Tax=unclassified Pseudomonas TaxID=196821 RepID=UPI00210E585B|nr:hypothetical protein [Pseudomonas sp. NBRC 111135]
MVAELAQARGLGVECRVVELRQAGHGAGEVHASLARHGNETVHGLAEDLARLLDGDEHQAQVQGFDNVLGVAPADEAAFTGGGIEAGHGLLFVISGHDESSRCIGALWLIDLASEETGIQPSQGVVMNKMQKQFLEEHQRLIADFKAKSDALGELVENGSDDPDLEQKANQLMLEMTEANERINNHMPPVSWLTSLLFKLRGRLTG